MDLQAYNAYVEELRADEFPALLCKFSLHL